MPKKTVSPPVWKSILIKWLGIFPSVLIISYTFKWLGLEPMFLKLFFETILLVPLLTFIVTPVMKTLFSDWLYKGLDIPKSERETLEVDN